MFLIQDRNDLLKGTPQFLVDHAAAPLRPGSTTAAVHAKADHIDMSVTSALCSYFCP